jgi:O-antigen ligase
VKELILSLLGRNATLTDRTEVWEVVLGLEFDPIVGAGFMSFWTGERMELIWRILRVKLVQAHSGYVEQYLNLGAIGIAFIAGIMLSGLLKVRKHLNVDPSMAMLRLCFIVTAVLYNYTEAAFYGINNVWLLLLLGTIDISGQQGAKKVETSTAWQQKILLRPLQLPFQPRPYWMKGTRLTRDTLPPQ